MFALVVGMRLFVLVHPDRESGYGRERTERSHHEEGVELADDTHQNRCNSRPGCETGCSYRLMNRVGSLEGQFASGGNIGHQRFASTHGARTDDGSNHSDDDQGGKVHACHSGNNSDRQVDRCCG